MQGLQVRLPKAPSAKPFPWGRPGSTKGEIRCSAATDEGTKSFDAQVCVVLGTQWGDEGKGKLVDILAQDYDVVARAQVELSPSLHRSQPGGRSSPRGPSS